jgi:glucose/arabinose dehydrogenase
MGQVFVYQDGALLGTFIDLADVNTEYFRGLISIAVDPEFASNGYVYLYYVYENNPAAPAAAKTARLVRVTADGNAAVPGSETVILGTAGGGAAEPSCSSMPAGADCIPGDSVDHFGGGLDFAPDGTLFLSTGDAIVNTSDVQDLDYLAGKVLHVKPDGTAADGNPFHTGDATANRSKVWAYGFRNPFRLGVEPSTGLPLIGDVGSFYWEELNLAEAGLNFGWPCYEGTAPQPFLLGTAFCTSFYQSDAATAHPVYQYLNAFLAGGSAVVAGVFYEGSTYPSGYTGAFFFGDFMKGWIKALRLGVDNQVLGDGPETILTDAGHPVAFDVSPDGDVYYLTQDFATGAGDLHRIVYQPGNRPPVVRGSATPNGGPSPLKVTFSSAGSYDPEEANLTYHWDFDDGSSSSEPDPSHTYVVGGSYDAQLTVEDADGGVASATVHVVAGNQLPVAVIDGPATGTAYEPGGVIAFAGHGSDAEDGPIDESQLFWKVVLHHCESLTGGCHSHLFGQATGDGSSLVAPGQGYELYYLEVVLTATDSAGLTGSTSIVIGPDTDGDGVLDQDELFATGTDRLMPDTDGDGCVDGAELGLNPEAGGMRDPLNFWDFFDTPNASGERDAVVDLNNDLFGVLFRYGTGDEGGKAPVNRYSDPLAPAPRRSYHPAFDRSPAPPGARPWDLGPPDGSIDLLVDIFGIAAQYGNACG